MKKVLLSISLIASLLLPMVAMAQVGTMMPGYKATNTGSTITGMTLAFDEEWNEPASSPLDPKYSTSYYYSPPYVYPSGAKPTASQLFFGRTIVGGYEDEVYVDKTYCGFGQTWIGNGVLEMSITRISPAPAVGNYPATTGNPMAMEKCALATPTAKPPYSDTHANYISALVTSQNSFAQTYGYWEIRAKLPVGSGDWFAFWLVPQTKTTANEGRLSEFDIIEHYAGALTVQSGSPPKPYVINRTGQPVSTSHIGTNLGETAYSDNNSLPAKIDVTQWHTYGALWTPTKIQYFIDGKEVYENAVADAQPHYWILNIAHDDRYPWDGIVTNQAMIDYVRVYK